MTLCFPQGQEQASTRLECWDLRADPYGQKPHPWPLWGGNRLAEALELRLPEAMGTLTCAYDPALPEAGVRAQPLSGVTVQSVTSLGVRVGSGLELSLALGQGSSLHPGSGSGGGPGPSLWALRANPFLFSGFQVNLRVPE